MREQAGVVRDDAARQLRPRAVAPPIFSEALAALPLSARILVLAAANRAGMGAEVPIWFSNEGPTVGLREPVSDELRTSSRLHGRELP